MASAIPETLRELLVMLDFIASVERGYKANLYNRSFCSTRSWYHSMVRTWSGESRDTLISQLKRLTVDTNSALIEFRNTGYLSLIITHIERARSGVSNLKTAYDDDPNVLSNLNLIMEDWNIQIQRERALIPKGE